VRAQLIAKGLQVDGQQQEAASADDSGEVTAIDPLNTKVGDTVTVTYYGTSAELTKPATPRVSAKTALPGASITLSWDTYQCPAGASPLSSYTVKVQGAAASESDITDLGRADNSTTIVAGASPGTITLRYIAYCGPRDTPQSSAVKVTVSAPSAPPTSSAPPVPTQPVATEPAPVQS
jgi:hypothetical protein